MSSLFQEFPDYQLPAVAMMLNLEHNEYAGAFENLRDRCLPSRTPGDLVAIAEATEFMLGKWQCTTDPDGDEIRNIIRAVEHRIDALHQVVIQEELQPYTDDSFLFRLGAACNDMIIALDNLVHWIHSRA